MAGNGGGQATPFPRIRDNSEVREASVDGVLRLPDGGYAWDIPRRRAEMDLSSPRPDFLEKH